MPGLEIMQFVAVAVTIATGLCVVYAIFATRSAYANQEQKLATVNSAIDQLKKLQSEFPAFIRRVESDGHALQKIALEIEAAVAMMKEAMGASMTAATERQITAIENLRDHIDIQEERLASILQDIAESLRPLPQVTQVLPSPPPPPLQLPESPAEVRHDSVDLSRFRKEVLSHDPALRFSVLKEWMSVNSLAILHRASRGWTKAAELIANVPSHLEPEAEILEGAILVVGTRDHVEKLAAPLHDLEGSSEFIQWFDAASDDSSPAHVPAVLVRSDGQWTVVSKGITSVAGLPVA
jgi:hypothetical protein